jgi:SAM-dependent methyltransferase
MAVNFDHSQNLYTLKGPQLALPILFVGEKPSSLLDVGCGTGAWLKAAMDFGIPDVLGVDGVELPPDQLRVPGDRVRHQDLTLPWHLHKRFDTVICLEVAEHLPPTSSHSLIEALCEHSNHIIFAAGCPNQPGQNHINCQWPEYWQDLFNSNGFACEDDIRPKMWNIQEIEVWYRQNIFTARRSPSAGRETRILGMVHPEFLPVFISVAGATVAQEAAKAASQKTHNKIMNGGLRFSDYPKMTVRAFVNRIKHRLNK